MFEAPDTSLRCGWLDRVAAYHTPRSRWCYLDMFKSPSPSPIIQPKVMPVPDSTAIMEAKRQQMGMIAAQSGRASTILDGTADKLGGA